MPAKHSLLVARLNDSDLSINMLVTKAEHDAFHSLPPGESNMHITVWDQVSARHYIVLRADCGAGCYCAAKAFHVLHGSQVSTDTEDEIAQRRSDALDEIYPARQKN